MPGKSPVVLHPQQAGDPTVRDGEFHFLFKQTIQERMVVR